MSDGPHLGDALSALLDGELSAGERGPADLHLAGCGACRAELDAIAMARSLLRGLPAVDPPFGFYERLLLRRARWRRGAVAIAGGAAAAVVLLTLATPPADTVDPAVSNLVERHAATASVSGDPVTQFVPIGVSTSGDR